MAEPEEQDHDPAGRRVRRVATLTVLLSLASLAALFAFYRVREQLDVLEAFRPLDPRAVVGALALHVLAHLVWAARFAAVSHGMGSPIGLGSSFRLVTAGVFGAAVTPGRVGGDGLRFALLHRSGWGPERAGQVLLGDRTLDVIFFLVVGLLGLAVLPGLLVSGSAVQGLLFAGLAAVALVTGLMAWMVVSPGSLLAFFRGPARWLRRRLPRRGPAVTRAVAGMAVQARAGLLGLVQKRQGWLFLALLLTYLTWLAEFTVLWLLLRGFGHDVPLAAVFFAGALLNILTSLPLTPGGSGVAEVGAMAVFASLAPGLTPAFVVVWRALTFYYDLVVGGAVASRGSRGLRGPPAPD